MVNKKLATLAVALSAAIVSQAQATTIDVTDTAWHTFDVDPVSAADFGSLGWIDLNDGSVLDFTINVTAPTLVTIVDGGLSGDQFEVFDNGHSLGVTSVAPNNIETNLLQNFDAALASGYSTATFLLGIGQHDLTGLLSHSAVDGLGQPIDGTVGGLRIAPVPLPGAALLFLSGGGLLSLFSRRRREV